MDRCPARSIIAMLMVDILKAFILTRIMTAILVIIISNTCSSTPRATSEDVLVSCALNDLVRLRLRTTA